VVEAQDVVDLRAAPAIDRLIVVADAADIFDVWCLLPRPACGERGSLHERGAGRVPLTPPHFVSSASPLKRGEAKEEADGACDNSRSHILRDVGVLIFFDQDVFEALLVLPEDIRVLAENADVFEQQIAEIGRG